MEKVVQKVVVSGVVADNGKVLIVQRAAGDDTYANLWELPGGKKEEFEDVHDTLVREVFEETGIKVKAGKLVDAFNWKNEKKDYTVDATELFFIAIPDGEFKLKLSDEHQNFAWITKDQIDNYGISPETKGIILKAFDIA